MKGQDKTTRSFVVGPITAYVEKKLVYSMISNKTGPFPRVQGKDGNEGLHLRDGGITPACAGKSLPRSPATRAAQDHPRVCGEKMISLTSWLSKLGSPPRVRGKAWEECRACECPGITPACAGKRIDEATSLHHARDHPRVCGEKHAARSDAIKSVGSPPRVRGKV